MTGTGSALSHLRVLDLSRILAGPWATQMLGDLGADIIKVERPRTGDDTRGWGPPFVDDMTDDADADAAARSAYFCSVNRNKRSLAIDITSPEGAAILRRLTAESDVLVENFEVGGLAKYGLDYESLRAVNPKLVYCSITGFGQDGPDAHRAGYDFMIQGMGGLMSVTGEADGMPMKIGVALVDVLTGTNAATAILAAVMHAARNGTGQHIDMSLFDVSVASLANQALNYMVSSTAPGRLGNAHPNIVPYQAFATADGLPRAVLVLHLAVLLHDDALVDAREQHAHGREHVVDALGRGRHRLAVAINLRADHRRRYRQLSGPGPVPPEFFLPRWPYSWGLGPQHY